MTTSARKFDLPPDLFGEEEPGSGVIDAWVGKAKSTAPPPRPKKHRETISASSFERSTEEVEEALRTGDWSAARATHLVALYAYFHELVYEVGAADLGPRERAKAALLAGKLTKERFGGDTGKAVAFVFWTWEREQEREDWRRARGREGSRIGWALQFSPRLVPDYELSTRRTMRPGQGGG